MRTITQQTIAAILALAITFTFNACSSSDDEGGSGGSSFSDKGNNIANYKTVKIGEQTWMAENLNYAVEGSKCYGEGGQVVIDWDRDEDQKLPIYSTSTLSASEIQANCSKYGRLYNWEQAMRACPSGWHLPSDTEWTTLIDYVGGEDIAGMKLKAKSGWNDYEGKSCNGTDDYGFSALPGGIGFPDGDFYVTGSASSWWSSTDIYSSEAYLRYIDLENVDGLYRHHDVKDYYNSVRCIKD